MVISIEHATSLIVEVSKTLSASDIATDKDGDTLKIVIASTTSGAKVTLNADGTLTFTADKEGAGEILVMVTDDKSEPVAVKVTYNVTTKPIDYLTKSE